MKRYLLAYATTAVAFCAFDFLWLTMIAPGFYQSQIGSMLLEKPNLVPALAFYILYVTGLVVFAVIPALGSQSWLKAAALGGLLGLVAYATYDLSNLATLHGWTWSITIVDIAWGTTVSALASICGYFGTAFLTRTSA